MAGLLLNMETNAKGKRMITRFTDILKSHFDRYQEELKELLLVHAEMENGNFKTESVEVDGRKKVIMKDDAAYKNDYYDLAMESAVIVENEENEEMLKAVADIFLNATGILFDGPNGDLYDFYCERFENMKFEGDK